MSLSDKIVQSKNVINTIALNNTKFILEGDAKRFVKKLLEGIEGEYKLVCKAKKESETIYTFKQQLIRFIKLKAGERLT